MRLNVLKFISCYLNKNCISNVTSKFWYQNVRVAFHNEPKRRNILDLSLDNQLITKTYIYIHVYPKRI